MKSRTTHIHLKNLIYGMEWRKVVHNRKLSAPYIFCLSIWVWAALYMTLNNPQKNTIENKEFQQEYQEAPKFAKDSLLHTFNITPPISLENEEIE